MRPLRLSARNLRTWQVLKVDIPLGIVAVVGENGAGKSSLVNAIDLALFGSGKELKRAHSRKCPDDTVSIDLEFEHGGQVYRVRRSYSTKGAGKPRLDFEALAVAFEWPDPDDATSVVDEEWESLSRETIAATQERIEDLLGLSRATFRASAFLAQDDGAAFTQADPSVRKAILLEALGVRVWDRLRDKTAARRQDAERELSATLARAEALQGELAQRDGLLAVLRAAEQEREPLLADLELGLQGLEQVRRELEDANDQALEHERRKAHADAAKARANELASRGMAEEGQIARSRQLVFDQREQVASATKRGDLAAARVVELEQKIKAATDGEAKCPTCAQVLAGDALLSALAVMNGELRGAENARDAALKEAQDAEARAAQVETDLQNREREIQALKRDAQAARADADDAAAAVSELAIDIPALRERVKRAEQSVEGQRVRIAFVDTKVTRSRAAVERLDGVAANLTLVTRERDHRSELVGTLKFAEKAYGRDGIPALILEASALPQLEAEANRIVAELGREYRFELRTQRETQAGTIKEALDIVVQTATGEGLYEDFSGGERTRLDLALRIALARLLAARRGADVRCLVIDEPAYLDDEGFAHLAGVLRGLSSEFESVLVVSHVEALRDAFDSAIIVGGGADTGEPSRLEEV